KGLSEFQQVLAAHWYQAEGWSLTVFAVPSAERSAIRQLLQAAGLPAVQTWLKAPRPDTWFAGMRRFEVGCWLPGGDVAVSESKDHRTLAWGVVAGKVAAPAGRSPSPPTAGRPRRGH